MADSDAEESDGTGGPTPAVMSRRQGVQIDRDNRMVMSSLANLTPSVSNKPRPPASVASNLENVDPNTDIKRAVWKKRQLQIYTKFLERGNIPDSKTHQHFLGKLGESEKLAHNMGQISKVIYSDIDAKRKFDRYCRPVSTKQNARTSMLNRLKSSLLPTSTDIQKRRMTDEEHQAASEKAARESSNYLTTAPKDRELRDRVFGPVGSHNASYAIVYKSDGNEGLYNYDGFWGNGKPGGWGKYRFADGCDYDGFWGSGRQHEAGTSKYPNKSVYAGDWKDGYYHGYGELKYASGAVYKGYWRHGKRYGFGEILYPNGTTYRGEWKFGRPYGFGEMCSKSSGIVFRGMWRRGYINGMGTLHLSESDYIARDWSRVRGRTFKELVDDARSKKAIEAADRARVHDDVFGEATYNITKFYIKQAKSKIYLERKEARDKKADDARKFKAQMRAKRRKIQMESLKLMQGE